MEVMSFDSVIVVEMVAKDTDRVGIHSISNVLHVMNVVSWVRRGWDIDTALGMGILL